MARIKKLLGLSLATDNLTEDLSNKSISNESLNKVDRIIYNLCERIL